MKASININPETRSFLLLLEQVEEAGFHLEMPSKPVQ
jgi:hypothetical protein